MKIRTISITLFIIGLIFLFIHTTFPFLWAVFGISSSYPLSKGVILNYLSGFTPIIGALILFISAKIAERMKNK